MGPAWVSALIFVFKTVQATLKSLLLFPPSLMANFIEKKKVFEAPECSLTAL